MSFSKPIREPDSLVTGWRNRLRQQQAELRADFEENGNTALLLRKNRQLVDQLLTELWQQSGLVKNVCLIAVGGYGRGDLYPYSDVDLLILLPGEVDEATNLRIETLVGLFWDIGLAVGHSVRNLAECIEESQKDITIQTNMLEARLILGNRHLYQAFRQASLAAMNVRYFFEGKVREQYDRHAKFNDTTYNLEPNIKESPGGLRDLQTMLWITRSLGLGASWNELVQHGLISTSEARQLRRHELYLQMLRTRLHYLANRREDRLIFDLQNELAAGLGYVHTRRKRASEQLMHHFYRSARYVSLMNEILLDILREHIYPEQHEVLEINARFEARNRLLNAKSDMLFQRQPSAILESFLLLEKHSELRGMSANLLRTLHRVKNLVNREFRQDPVNKRLFMEIISQPSGVTSAFRRMNRYGVLGNYIPAFGRIVGQMQHDLFHVYTVDEHILNVLRNLRRFSLPACAHEFPLCSKLFATFDAPHLLYLGALFHDIAKGRGGDHSTLGTADARRFCKSHGIAKADTELVAWLVESHLLMSHIAQKSDLSDPSIVENFAKRMGSERRLIALYLLTVADIRGTSPAVWNAWKAKLLENLFYAGQRLLKGMASNPDEELAYRQKQATHILSHYGLALKTYQPLWEKLGKSYFLRHASHEIAWHSRLLISHLHTPTPIVRARLSPDGDGIQVMIYMRDSDYVFAKICGFFERLGYTIVEAKIHTTQNGYVLDSFAVLDQNEQFVRYRDLISYIEFELSKKLTSHDVPELPSPGRVSRQVKHMPITPRITIEPEFGLKKEFGSAAVFDPNIEPDSQHHLLQISAGDRPGLLSRLAHIFLKHGILMHTAKINTLGNRAEDIFLISAKSGGKLDNASIQSLQAELVAQF